MLGLRIRARLTRLVAKTKRLLHEAIRPLPAVVGLLRDLTRSRDQLIAENALLRQQLIVASRKVKRPVFTLFAGIRAARFQRDSTHAGGKHRQYIER